MIVIRRMVDKHRAYTAIFLSGSEPKIFPTSDYEHAKILQIFKQDRPYFDLRDTSHHSDWQPSKRDLIRHY